MKKILLLTSLCCMALLVCLLLVFQFDERKEGAVGQSQELPSHISVQGDDWIYKYTVQDEEDAYYGLDCFEDEENRYFINTKSNFVVGVEVKNINPSDKTIELEKVIDIAEGVFSKYVGDFIVGEVSIILHEYDGVEYPVEFIEQVDGYETGTKGLVLIGGEGTLYAASFMKGDQYVFYPEKMLTEEDALDLALGYVQKTYQIGLLRESEVIARITTINNQTSWYFTLPVETSGSRWITYYYVLMDV